jgi:hypothetical protein
MGRLEFCKYIMKKQKNTNLFQFYRARGTLRNTKPLVTSLYTIWRTWHGSMSVIPSLEYFYRQKLDLFEFAIHYKVLDLIFLKTIRDSSDMQKACLRSCDHLSILSGRGEFSIRHNLTFMDPCIVIQLWIQPTRCNLLFLVSSTCFGRCFRPSSEALDCISSLW